MSESNNEFSVENLFRDLSVLPEVEAIALGGSRAGEVYDEKSDYDVYLYCTAPVAEEVRRELLGRYCSVMEIGNHFWEYEDNCTLNNGIDIDVLYRNLDDFTNDVASVVEDCRPRNGYTTCMWHNLRTCKILYDRDGRLAAAKARFDVPYPPLLRERIVERNRKLLRGSMPAYEGQIAKAAKRGDLVSVNHRTAAFLESYFDVLFALNGQTHPGEKRLVQLCKKQCKILPERFEENLESLFAHLFAGDGRVTEDVGRIVDELEKCISRVQLHCQIKGFVGNNMESKKCPKCGSGDIMEGSLTASYGFTFIPNDQKGLVKKSSFLICSACKDCGAVFDLTLTDKPSKLTNK